MTDKALQGSVVTLAATGTQQTLQNLSKFQVIPDNPLLPPVFPYLFPLFQNQELLVTSCPYLGL